MAKCIFHAICRRCPGCPFHAIRPPAPLTSHISNEQLTIAPRGSSEIAVMDINKKSDNDRNMILGVYLSIKTNSLTRRNFSLFTVFDLGSPLNFILLNL